MIFLRQLPVAMLLFIFIACNQSAGEQELRATADILELPDNPETAKREETKFGLDPIAPPPSNNKKKHPGRQATAPPQPNPDWDKKIIRNASLTIEVADYKKYNEMVH